MSTIVVIVNTMHIWDECMKVEYNTKINAAAKGSPNISNFCTFFSSYCSAFQSHGMQSINFFGRKTSPSSSSSPIKPLHH